MKSRPAKRAPQTVAPRAPAVKTPAAVEAEKPQAPIEAEKRTAAKPVAARRARSSIRRRIKAPADTAPATTMVATDLGDRRTHIERLNPGDNPAAIPGQGRVHTR